MKSKILVKKSEDTKTVVSKRIIAERERAGMSQIDLAKMVGLGPSTISQIEAGINTPSLPVIQKIAEVLQLSLDYLTGEVDTSEFEAILRNEKVQLFFNNYRGLSAKDKTIILEHVEFLKYRNKEREKRNG